MVERGLLAGAVTAAISLPFRVGTRTLWQVRRRLLRVTVPLEQARKGSVPALPQSDGDGYLIASLPAEALPPLLARHPQLKPFIRQRYRRFYAELGRGFDHWLGTLSSKSRSTLKRKVRKLAERSGGDADLRCYRSPNEVVEFYRHARAVSALTYQERLLRAGLPEGDAALAAMQALAARDAMRGWILFLDARPIAYLYAPADGETLIYAHLGYDPEHADLSPGSVLQYEAMRQLMDEGRFALFDFTEGEGQHKRLFSTGEVECVDLLLLRRTPANLLAAWSLAAFDGGIEGTKALLKRLNLESLARRFRR
jgi:CelD/BcsL family acetyltransferase involved in cellulose biosynthesis